MKLVQAFLLASSERLALEECQGAHFNAFARRYVSWSGWIVEGAVRSPAGAAILQRIVTFENHRFVALHLGKVVPAVRAVESGVVHLAAPVGINARAGNQFVGADAARVGDGQVFVLHRLIDGPPNLDNGEPVLE